MSGSGQRWRWGALGVVVFVLAAAGAAGRAPVARAAASATHFPSGTTLSADTTWTTAGSPYVLDGGFTVASGVTLTIQPGVVVKVTGQTSTVRILGVIRAVGTAAEPIVFTSARDDSVGGDSNADGPSQGAPGDWMALEVNGSVSQVKWVEVRYGGYGSARTYGALKMLTGTATLDHVTVTRSQNSGVVVDSSETLMVTNSVISDNGADGITVNDRAVLNVAKSFLAFNGINGVHFLINSSPPASTLMSNDIIGNGDSGVGFLIQSIPSSSWPHGNFNNFYNNTQAISANQITAFNGIPSDVDWTLNYWGPGAYWLPNPSICPYPGYVASEKPRSFGPPEGVSPTALEAFPNNTLCVHQYPTIGISGWYADYSPNTPQAALLQQIGYGPGIHAVNASGSAGDPVNTLTGAFNDHATDVALPGIGVPFVFERYYASNDGDAGRLGPGWRDGYSAFLVVDPNGDVTLHGENGQQVHYLKQVDERIGVSGGKTAREIAEQHKIDELGGIKALGNARNPIGRRRFGLMPEGYTRP